MDFELQKLIQTKVKDIFNLNSWFESDYICFRDGDTIWDVDLQNPGIVELALHYVVDAFQDKIKAAFYHHRKTYTGLHVCDLMFYNDTDEYLNHRMITSIFNVEERFTKDKSHSLVIYRAKYGTGMFMQLLKHKKDGTWLATKQSQIADTLLHGAVTHIKWERTSSTTIPKIQHDKVCIPHNEVSSSMYFYTNVVEHEDCLEIEWYEIAHNSHITDKFTLRSLQKVARRITFKIQDGVIVQKSEDLPHPPHFKYFEIAADLVPNPFNTPLHEQYPTECQPLYAGDKVFVDAKNRLYIELGGHWVHMARTIDNIDDKTERLPEDVLSEIKRYRLAQSLMM